MKRNTIILLINMAIISFTSGCISNPRALSSVGPDPMGGTASGPQGWLEVFSGVEKTEIVESDIPVFCDPHSSYDINAESGKMVKFVPNHSSDMDEWPDRVALPAGNYNVVAQSKSYGLVKVSVLVQQGKTTVVHLDDNWLPSSRSASDQLVYLPNGDAMGWRSSLIVKSSN
jgi:hypothetical protein